MDQNKNDNPYPHQYHYPVANGSKPEPERLSEHDFVPAETNRKEYTKLFGIYFAIFAIATLMSTFQGFNWQEWMRWFMGGFFIIFGSFKLISYEMFTLMFPGYDVVARRYKLYAYLYPFIQLGLGVAFILNGAALPIAIPAFIVSVISTYGVFVAVAKEHHSLRCACLGNIIKLPLSTVSLYEDLTMALMALVMIIAIVLA